MTGVVTNFMDGQTVHGYDLNNAFGLAAAQADLISASGASVIGYSYNGSSYFSNVQDKLRQFVTFEDFGAVGDGVTNDFLAIQSAINSGKPIKVLKTYGVSSQLTGVSGLTFIGNGMFKSGIKALSDMDSIIYFEDKSDISILNMYFDGNSHTISNLRFYSKTSPNNIYIENSRFTGTKNDGTLFYGTIEISEVPGFTSARYNNVNIKNNYFHDCGTHGAIVAYADVINFTGNTLKNIGQHGFEAVSSTKVIESHNNIDTCGTVGPGGSGLGVGTHTTEWVISDNVIKNCKGDAPITCEFTSIYGSIDNNDIVDSFANAGINVSFGSVSGNLPPFDVIRNISVTNNRIKNKAGVSTSTTAIGINAYSSSVQGIGINVSDNIIDGFNIGLAGQYLNNSNFNNNIVLNLTGANSVFILMAWVSKSSIVGNKCNSTTGDHAIKLMDYAGNHCDGVTVQDNIVFSSGASASKALVYIEGTGTHNVIGNQTSGSSNYVNATGASTITMSNNLGALSATPFLSSGGATLLAATGNSNSINDFSNVGGIRLFSGTAIPTTGTYRYNDRIINTNCTVGQPKGWVCTAAGTPGTWVSEGNL